MKQYIILLSLIFSTQIAISQEQDDLPFLTIEEKEYFKQQAVDKVNSLSIYLSNISDKQIDMDLKDENIEQAMKLFDSENNKVEVSSKIDNLTKSYLIRQYFNRVKTLPYSRVEITWYDITFYQDPKLGDDGKYHATMVIYQKFRGFLGDLNRPAYEDVTEKIVEVTIEKEEFLIGGVLRKKWDLKLGDIRVTHTS